MLAPLNPHEEVMLRHVALGVAPAKDIERLKVLVLVEEHGAGLRLRRVGKKRYLDLPNSSGIFYTDAPDEALAKVAEFISKSRG